MSVPTKTTTASTAPTMAERTGTALRPRPGSSAERMPVIVGTGSPGLAAVCASRELRPGVADLRAARCGACQYAWADATTSKLTNSTRRPPASTVQSNAVPGDGSTRRTGPIGVKLDRPTATTTARNEPTTTAPATPKRPSMIVIVVLHPTRGHLQVIGADAELAANDLSDNHSAASAVIAPNTPSAMPSGLIARSALASMVDATDSR